MASKDPRGNISELLERQPVEVLIALAGEDKNKKLGSMVDKDNKKAGAKLREHVETAITSVDQMLGYLEDRTKLEQLRQARKEDKRVAEEQDHLKRQWREKQAALKHLEQAKQAQADKIPGIRQKVEDLGRKKEVMVAELQSVKEGLPDFNTLSSEQTGLETRIKELERSKGRLEKTLESAVGDNKKNAEAMKKIVKSIDENRQKLSEIGKQKLGIEDFFRNYKDLKDLHELMILSRVFSKRYRNEKLWEHWDDQTRIRFRQLAKQFLSEKEYTVIDKDRNTVKFKGDGTYADAVDAFLANSKNWESNKDKLESFFGSVDKTLSNFNVHKCQHRDKVVKIGDILQKYNGLLGEEQALQAKNASNLEELSKLNVKPKDIRELDKVERSLAEATRVSENNKRKLADYERERKLNDELEAALNVEISSIDSEIKQLRAQISPNAELENARAEIQAIERQIAEKDRQMGSSEDPIYENLTIGELIEIYDQAMKAAKDNPEGSKFQQHGKSSERLAGKIREFIAGLYANASEADKKRILALLPPPPLREVPPKEVPPEPREGSLDRTPPTTSAVDTARATVIDTSIERKRGADATASTETAAETTAPAGETTAPAAESPELERGRTLSALAERQSTEKFKAQFRLRKAEQHALNLLIQSTDPYQGLEDVRIGLLNFEKGKGAVIKRLNAFYDVMEKTIQAELERFHQAEKQQGEVQDKAGIIRKLEEVIQGELSKLKSDLETMLLKYDLQLEGAKILELYKDELRKDLQAILDNIEKPEFEVDTSVTRSKDKDRLENWRHLKRQALLGKEERDLVKLRRSASAAPDQKELVDQYLAQIEERQRALEAEQKKNMELSDKNMELSDKNMELSDKNMELRDRLAQDDIDISRANERARAAEGQASGLNDELQEAYAELSRLRNEANKLQREKPAETKAARDVSPQQAATPGEAGRPRSVTEMREHTDEQRKEMEALRANIASLKAQLSAFEEIRGKLREKEAQVLVLERGNAGHAGELQKMKQQIADLQGKLANTNAVLETARKDLEGEITDRVRREEEGSKDLQTIQSLSRQLAEAKQRSEQQVAELQRSKDGLQNQLQGFLGKLQSVEADLRQRLEAANALNEGLVQQLRTAKAHSDGLIQQLEAEREKGAEAEKAAAGQLQAVQQAQAADKQALQEAQAEASRGREGLADAKRRNEQLEQQNRELGQQNRDNQQALEAGQQDIEQLRQQLAEANQRAVEAKGEAERAQADLEAVGSDLERISGELEAAAQVLEGMKGQVQVAEQRAAELQQEATQRMPGLIEAKEQAERQAIESAQAAESAKREAAEVKRAAEAAKKAAEEAARKAAQEAALKVQQISALMETNRTLSAKNTEEVEAKRRAEQKAAEAENAVEAARKAEEEAKKAAEEAAQKAAEAAGKAAEEAARNAERFRELAIAGQELAAAKTKNSRLEQDLAQALEKARGADEALGRLRAENEVLRAALHSHGIDPDKVRAGSGKPVRRASHPGIPSHRDVGAAPQPVAGSPGAERAGAGAGSQQEEPDAERRADLPPPPSPAQQPAGSPGSPPTPRAPAGPVVTPPVPGRAHFPIPAPSPTPSAGPAGVATPTPTQKPKTPAAGAAASPAGSESKRAADTDGLFFRQRAVKVGLKSKSTKSLPHSILSAEGMKEFGQKIRKKIEKSTATANQLSISAPASGDERKKLEEQFNTWKSKPGRQTYEFDEWYKMKVGKQKVYSDLVVLQDSTQSSAFYIKDNDKYRTNGPQNIVYAKAKQDEIEIQLLDHSPKSIMAFLEAIRVACSATGHWGKIPLDNFEPPASYYVETFADKMGLKVEFDAESRTKLDSFKRNPTNADFISKFDSSPSHTPRKSIDPNSSKPAPH